MASYFLDSSAIVKRYVTETGTGWVQDLFLPVRGNRFTAAVISGAEVTAAIARRRRAGSISAADASRTLSHFGNDFFADFRLVEISSTLIADAMHLADRHGLRGYDAVQLAAAMSLGKASAAYGIAVTFVAADTELNAAAAAEGFAIEDPNTHP